LVTSQFLLRQRLEPLPEALELAPTHGAFFGHAVLTLGQHVEFLVLGEQFDLDPLAHRLPGLVQERGFQLAQPAFRRADQIDHFGVAGAHLFQNLLRRDTPVHDPNALGLALVLLDARQKIFERGLVRRVARQHFVGQGKALRGDVALRIIRWEEEADVSLLR
jgi:hypothetical protein